MISCFSKKNITKFSTNFQPITTLQTVDSSFIFKYQHRSSSSCMLTLDISFRICLDSLSCYKNVFSPTKILLRAWNFSWLFIMHIWQLLIWGFPSDFAFVKKKVCMGMKYFCFFMFYCMKYIIESKHKNVGKSMPTFLHNSVTITNPKCNPKTIDICIRRYRFWKCVFKNNLYYSTIYESINMKFYTGVSLVQWS